VSQLSELSWNVEKEDGEEYIVNYNIFKEKYTCSCHWNISTGKDCKHIRFVKEYIINKKSEFDE
jgi:hypothetical protein